jgi:hypothetical protein
MPVTTIKQLLAAAADVGQALNAAAAQHAAHANAAAQGKGGGK